MERSISRREFGKKLARVASGAAVFAFQPSCSSTRPSRPMGQLLRDDLADLSGTLLFDDPARQAAADDFGHIVRRLPLAVLKPGSIQDIVKLVQFANRRDLKIAMRGAGHAMFGDAQVDGGVVIDSSSLNSVRVIKSSGRRLVELGPGALWGQVWDATDTEKLTPPVNVDTGVLSVGGTISTGGFGGTSWREGFQVDHVTELEVVTGHGEFVTCSDERNVDLFNATLAGMGQCGVIVKVVMALVPAPTHVQFFVLSYPDLQTATADLTLLVKDGRFTYLDGRTTPRPGGGFIYNLEAGAFYDAPNGPREAELLAGLKFASQTARVMTYAAFNRVPGRFPALPHPWLYLCLPASRFVEYATGVFASPAQWAFSAPRFSVWRRSSIKRPLVCVPNEDLVARFQLSRTPAASADVASLVAMNRSLYERARAMGGTRLTTTAIPFSQGDWSQHFGPAWESFRKAKQRFDPNNVLTPAQGMFPT